MSKKKALKAAALDVPVPRDRDEANLYIALIGEAQHERARIEADMNDHLAKVKADAEAKAKPLAEQIAARMRGLQTWCEANREQLTGGKTKTVKMAAGEISWRNRPPKVNLRNIEKALEWLKASKLLRFIRTKEEIDKDGILKEPGAVRESPYISVGSAGEEFTVKPFETELEEVA